MLFSQSQSRPIEAFQEAERHMSRGDLASAIHGYESLLGHRDLAPLAHLRLSLIASGAGRLREATAQALAAYAKRRPDPDLMEMLCKRLLTLGEMRLAIACAEEPAIMVEGAASVTAGLGRIMCNAFETEVGLRLLQQSRERGLSTPALHYQIGVARMYGGDLEGAERELESALRGNPDLAHAHRTVSKLRTQTPESNHVDRLRAAIGRGAGTEADMALLQYALFKELDDLGDAPAAWRALAEGMRLRRRLVRYDPEGEQRLFAHLRGLHAEPAAMATGHEGPVPIFIVGMPRSGTTLLERMLGNHDGIADTGELYDFVTQLRWMCDQPGAAFLDATLAERAQDIDWAELGSRYLAHTQWRSKGRAFFTDKMPANFLNVAYILRALPQARILHVVRDPMDTCFSNLKELFAAAYPHSYDQAEMADHFGQYRQLMTHWHELFPGRILDVGYERLAAEPERTGREVLAFCGLPWREGLTAVEARTGTVATASAMQVREPIHQRFVGQWRRYGEHLAPLRERLGIYGH